MKENERLFKVTINEVKGTCDSNLFKKMAQKGDLTANRIQDFIDTEFQIDGYADCTIETKDKTFNMFYIDTEYDLICTGSEIFKESVKDYYGECEKVKILEIKTKNGKTYKAVPILKMDDIVKEESEKEESKTNE